jgi:hypothetical protein
MALLRIPGDRWIAGQRVVQRVQCGDLTEAQRVARECRSAASWCASLVGYASHLLKQDARADSAFSVALAGLGGEQRCQWEAVDDLVYGDADRNWYTSLPCDEQAAVNRVIWWLADPLYITRGNERRSAHLYREVFRRLFIDSNEELASASLTILDSRGSETGRPPVRSDSLGRFTIHAPAPGRYSLRVTRIGNAPLTTAPVALLGGEAATLTLAMRQSRNGSAQS